MKVRNFIYHWLSDSNNKEVTVKVDLKHFPERVIMEWR